MLIWLSGAYGVGKSTVAMALRDKLDDAMVFDAEAVGNAVRDNYPVWPCGAIFEDYPLWAEFCFRLIMDIHAHYAGDIIVDMTLVREASRVNIIDRLRSEGMDVHFIVLTAARQTIHDRILARGESEDCWCMQNLDMAMQAATNIAGGTHIDTTGKAIADIATEILDIAKPFSM